MTINMKPIYLMIIMIYISMTLHGQITIGYGTTSGHYPFNLWKGYARSASIYTSTELGSSKLITALGWNAESGEIESCPVKIYLKLVSDGTFYPITWGALIDGATLVYDASASFPSPGWTTIDIADFVYLNTGDQNLLVLCEANYGGNGASNGPVFFDTYDYSMNQHEFWEQNETPPTGSGTPNGNRPNIQVSFVALSNPVQPSGFFAQAASTTQINLTWKRNIASNNVMVAYNTVNTFGTPSGNYSAGNPITGGGTVLYNGSAEACSHTGLNPSTTYYYKAYSVLPSIPTYSSGTGWSAATLCAAITGFPLVADFESATYPPVCWSIAQKPWVRDGSVSAFGIGSGSAYADFYNIPSGNSFDLISPTLDLSALSGPSVSFDHAYATYATEVDRLELWASSDDGNSFSLLKTWLGGPTGPLNTGGATGMPYIPASNEWASKSFPIPAGTNKILFRGVSELGNNLYLDNIYISDPATVWNGSVSVQWGNALNWTPGVVPLGTQNVVIPSGKPFSPVVSTTGNACKGLSILTGANLTISVGAGLTIMGNVTIQNTATMTNNGSLTIKGNLTNQNSK